MKEYLKIISKYELNENNNNIIDIIFNNAIEGFLILDLESNKIKVIDKKLKKTLKYEDIQKLKFEDIFPENQIRIFQNELINNFKNENNFNLLDKNFNLISFSGEYYRLIKEDNDNIYLIVFKDIIKFADEIEDREKLLFNYKYFKALIENINDGISIIDKNGNVSYASKTVSKILGYTLKEIYSMSLSDIIHPEDLDVVMNQLQLSYQNPGISIDGGIARVKCKDGKYIYNKATLTNMLDDPLINGIIDTFHEVTENYFLHQKNEKILEELTERVKEQTLLNKVAKLTFDEITIPELLEQTVNLIPTGFHFPEYTNAFISYDDLVFQTTEYSSLKENILCVKRDINYRELRICISVNNPNISSEELFLEEEYVLIDSIANVILTKINQIETYKYLLVNIDKNKFTLSAVSDTIWFWDLSDNSLIWNEGINSTFKHTKEQIDKLNNIDSWIELIHSEDRDDLLRDLFLAINSDKEYWEGEYRLLTGNNNYAYVLDRAYIRRNKAGKATKLYGVIENHTERKEKENEILLKNKMFATIAEVNNKLLEYNDWYKVLGECFELIGQTVKVDRVYYFDNYVKYETNELFINQKLEWSAEGIEPQIENPDLQNVPHSLVEDFIMPLLENKAFYKIVSKMEDTATKQVLQEQNILSFIVFPIFIKNNFYGFIGFDECKYERKWKDYEIDFLKTLSLSISKAIEGEINRKEIEDKVIENQLILDSIGDGFTIINNDSEVIYWNNKAEELTNVKYENIIRKNVWDFFPTLVGTEYYNNVQKSLKEKKGFYQSKLFLENSQKWLEINIYPYKNGLSFFFRDISYKIQSEKEIEKLSYVAKNTNDIVIITDIERKIEWVNEAFSRITEYEMNEVIGKNPGDFLQGTKTNESVILKLRNSLNKKESVSTRILNYSKSGKEYWLDMTINPVFDEYGEFQNFIAIERVITDLVEFEENLYKINENLENMVSQRTQELEYANQELQLLNNEKDRFLGIVAHDLKNPLAGIKLILDLIQVKFKRNFKDNPDFFDKDIDEVNKLILRITRNINELLEINKIDRGKFKLDKSKINLSLLFNELIGQFNVQAKDKNINLKYNIEDISIISDLSSIEIISNNLISNALKYSRLNSKVEVNIYTEKSNLVIKIKDSGPGFTDEDKSKIFQAYTKLSAKPTANENSSGLGLSIVKNIVDLNKGTIQLITNKGIGSEFTIKIPVDFPLDN